MSYRIKVKPIELIFVIIVFFCSKALYSQCWSQAKITSQQNYSLSNIQFLNENVGYCQEFLGSYDIGVSTDFLYKTIDGGKTWKTHINAPRDIYEGYYVINENLFFLYGYYNLIRTEDAGKTWTASVQNNNYIFRKMYFLNTNIGWATSYPGNIWKTIDGGKKWNIIYNYNYLNGPSPSVGNQIVFLNENIGFFLTNKIFKTVNSGVTWQDMGIWFPTDYQIIENKLIVLTEKSKITFDLNGNIISNTNHFFHPHNSMGELSGIDKANFCFINGSVGWYTSTQGVHYTKDGGLNWSKIYINKTNDLYFDRKGTGVLIGNDYKNHYFYTCNFEQHDKDFYDRCYFGYKIEDPSISKTFIVSNNISRQYYQYDEAYETPRPSCWSTNEPYIRKPYWFSFSGNGKVIKIHVNKNSISSGNYLKAALYSGDCKNLTILNCGQIDDFNNTINFQIISEINKQYYVIFDGKGFETVKFNMELNLGLVNSIEYENRDEIKIYPTPCSDILFIEKLNTQNKEFYQIYDISGRIMFDGYVTDNSINVTHLDPGIYILKSLSTEKKILYKKFLKI